MDTELDTGYSDDWEAREARLRAEIAEHAAAGREVERERAAWRLAASIMTRTLPRSDDARS